MASANSKSTRTNPKKNRNTNASKAEARRARVEEQRRAEQARERRNRIITVAVSAAILAGLVGGGWYLLDAADAKEQAQAAPVSGEKTWAKLSQTHVDTAVNYPMTPPVGGDHAPVWQNCNGDVYTDPIQNENAVHSLEHGAVWITYNDKASDADVKALSDKVAKTPYTLISPYPDQSSPITLSAWGHQLNVTKRSDPRVSEFLEKYVQGRQTPEPGAACTGGKSA
ncbi:DUF3105 domain-containing protein [Streptomyces justiciae]|uniref:DUF3105 domain-containing protein n=1 Tax=Streptomyces justiciae TaxID=2780140 RepID=UPI0021182C38|nr:DUF3105 domain-containing protein [Streptomyces justiciae]MCW8380592.1 DUF3105 domain-containing protein [Streptomyces justiciae]